MKYNKKTYFIIYPSIVSISFIVVLLFFLIFTFITEDMLINLYENLSERWLLSVLFRFSFYGLPIILIYIYSSLSIQCNENWSLISLAYSTRYVFGLISLFLFTWNFLSFDVLFPDFSIFSWGDTISGFGGYILSEFFILNNKKKHPLEDETNNINEVII